MPQRPGSTVERIDKAASARVGWGTLPADGAPWQFAMPEAGVVAVGDLQGDLGGLDAILRGAGLVNGSGDWCGGSQHLVLVGDLVGGNADAGLLVHFVCRIERQAERAGGLVHALLGNHDVLPAHGAIDKWTGAEKQFYRDHPARGAPSRRARDAFRGDSALARWLRRRNAIVRIGDHLFAHAGIDSWFATTDPGAVNATVRAWIAHWQGVGGEPPRDTRWAVGVPGMSRESRFAKGPLWTRGFKATGRSRPPGGPSRSRLAHWLAVAGVRRLVLGHAPVEAAAVELAHPYYGDQVVRLDTRIGDERDGALTALRIDGSALRALQFGQTLRDPDCRRREHTAFLCGQPARWWHSFGRWLLRPIAALFGRPGAR